MFAGFIDRFTTVMREPMYALGNALSDIIYAPKEDRSAFPAIVAKVNKTEDASVLEEVWFVLAKAIDTSNNDYVMRALEIADQLVHNCGSRVYNACTPLFMRRVKELIIVVFDTV